MKLTSNRFIYSEITEKHIEEIHRMNSLARVPRFNTLGIPESIEETASLLHNVIYNRFMKKRTLFGWSDNYGYAILREDFKDRKT